MKPKSGSRKRKPPSARVSRRRPLAGFSLPEVLLAVVLLGLAAVAVGQTVRSALGVLERSREVGGEKPLQSLATRALLRSESRELAEEGGRLDLPDRLRLEWSSETETTGIPDLFAVTLDWEADREAGERKLYLYRPEWSDPVDRDPLQERARRAIEDRLRDQRWEGRP
jgi:prepilin-type N-terminal cleavage/methylation domain-containing protein